MSSSDGVLMHETVLILWNRMKHSQDVAKILENQVDSAEKNILILQGQVRFANETICNLKTHFQETEKILTKLLEPNTNKPQVSASEPEPQDGSKDTSVEVIENCDVTTLGSAYTDSQYHHCNSGNSKISSDHNPNQDGGLVGIATDISQSPQPISLRTRRKRLCVPVISEEESSKSKYTKVKKRYGTKKVTAQKKLKGNPSHF